MYDFIKWVILKFKQTDHVINNNPAPVEWTSSNEEHTTEFCSKLTSLLQTTNEFNKSRKEP